MTKTNFILNISFLCILISCDLESEHNLGGGYFVFGSNVNTSVVKKVESRKGVYDQIICGEIVEYQFNDEYILILRNASNEAKEYSGDDSIWHAQIGYSQRQYWIIYKIENKVYGPLSFENYKKIKNKLNIKNLELNNIPLQWKFN